MQLLNNPWFTGIVGGIISGFIVYIVTERLLSKKQNKEYLQKVTTANNELLYVMHPLVAQKQIPQKVIIESIRESIARKYKVNKGDLYDIPLLVDDLIREVMENPFLDSQQKMDFCNKISELRVYNESINKNVQIIEKIIYEKGRLSSQSISGLLAITAATMVAFSSFLIGKDNIFMFSAFDNVRVLTLASVMAPIIGMMTILVLTKFKKQLLTEKENKKNRQEENS